ncbi:hypothetical protein MOUN0_O02256 [Monosporozyma unispora]|nr:hypothetical protein C6P44_000688 [Kazachstania unispora]
MPPHVYSVNKDDLILIALSVFVPPVVVIIRKGFFSRDFLLNLLLFVIFFFPAIIHAFYVVYETSLQRPYNNPNLSNNSNETNTNTNTISTSSSNKPSAEDEMPLTSNVDGINNGDFNMDLERDGNSEGLPNYDEITGQRSTTDNKIQH